MEPKYPEIEVELNDGNAFAIIGTIQKQLRRHGVAKQEIDNFIAEATSDDYNHLLQTCMKWVNVNLA